MTKGESNRLSAVEVKIGILETKIDGLVERINIQEKTIAAAMAAQERNIGTAMTASEKAIVKAEIANELRFGELDKKWNESVKNIETVIATLTGNQNLNTGEKTGVTQSKTNAKDVIFYILFAITAISFIISMFVK